MHPSKNSQNNNTPDNMSSTQGAPSSPTQIRSKKTILVNDAPKFDLESYIGNYSGRTRLDRLLLIGICSTVLGVEALKLGVREAKQGKDIRKYLELQNALEMIGPREPEAQRDTVWMDKTDKRNQAEAHRLESELKGYKQNLVKESIRMANEDLGRHYQATGELGKAFEAYSRMRQDVSAAKHIIEISRHLIEVAVEQKNWIAVGSNTQKIRQAMSLSEEDRALQPFLCASDGLALLDSGEYHSAALFFLATEAGMGQKYNTLMSPNDIAVYGGLCALATMERNELHKKVMENSSFRVYLELEPQIRRAITFFVNSRYSACLSIIEDYRIDYLLDIHLQKHVDELCHLIRSKSIVQYFIPFSCVTLDSLNQQFAAPGKTIDKELAAMIQRKDLEARIDTQNRVLTSVPSAPRAVLQSYALAVAKDYEHEARRQLQHMNINSADLNISIASKRGTGGMADMGYIELDTGSGRELRSGRGPHRSEY